MHAFPVAYPLIFRSVQLESRQRRAPSVDLAHPIRDDGKGDLNDRKTVRNRFMREFFGGTYANDVRDSDAAIVLEVTEQRDRLQCFTESLRDAQSEAFGGTILSR